VCKNTLQIYIVLAFIINNIFYTLSDRAAQANACMGCAARSILG